MPLIKGSEPSWTIELTDRELDYIIGLYSQLNADNNLQQRKSRSDKIDIIIQLSSNASEDTNTKYSVENLTTECKNEVLPEELFSWIDQKCHRQCFWIWLYMKKANVIPPEDNTNPTNPGELVKEIFYNFDLDLNNEFNGEVYNPILQTALFAATKPNLLRCPDTGMNTPQKSLRFGYKKNFLNEMKLAWSKRNNKAHKWIEPENTVQIDWAWEYLKKPMQLQLHSSMNSYEKYIMLITHTEQWNQDQIVLKYHLDNAKRAWSQKKHRDNRQGKKAYNFVLSEEVKEKLDQIAEYKDQKKNETLERLINNAHSEIDW